MSAAEHTVQSADDDVQEMLRAAEAQSTVAKLNRRAFLKVVGIAGGGLDPRASTSRERATACEGEQARTRLRARTHSCARRPTAAS